MSQNSYYGNSYTNFRYNQYSGLNVNSYPCAANRGQREEETVMEKAKRKDEMCFEAGSIAALCLFGFAVGACIGNELSK